MNAEFDFLVTARGLAGYFARQEASGGSRWTPGRVAADEWLRLVEGGSPSAEDLARLDDLMLPGIGDNGSAWQEMRIAYGRWRKSLTG